MRLIVSLVNVFSARGMFQWLSGRRSVTAGQVEAPLACLRFDPFKLPGYLVTFAVEGMCPKTISLDEPAELATALELAEDIFLIPLSTTPNHARAITPPLEPPSDEPPPTLAYPTHCNPLLPPDLLA